MKLMIIGVTLAGFAAFTPLNAQRPSGNQRTTRQNCTNTQSGSVTDVILGRRSASTVGCVDNRTNQRVNRTNQQVNGGGWYQVGNDGYGTIYERQVQDQYGNVVVQRARRDRNGNMSIISTRNVGNNGTYNNGGYNNGRYNNGTYNNTVAAVMAMVIGTTRVTIRTVATTMGTTTASTRTVRATERIRTRATSTATTKSPARIATAPGNFLRGRFASGAIHAPSMTNAAHRNR